MKFHLREAVLFMLALSLFLSLNVRECPLRSQDGTEEVPYIVGYGWPLSVIHKLDTRKIPPWTRVEVNENEKLTVSNKSGSIVYDKIEKQFNVIHLTINVLTAAALSFLAILFLNFILPAKK